MDGQELLEKYKPKKKEEFIGNHIQRSAISRFLECKDASKNGLIVLGPTGCGKTTLIELICNDMKYCVHKPCYETFTCHKDVEQYIESFLNTKSILDILNGTRRVLFLDDVEVLLSQDRYANTYLQSMFANMTKVGSPCKVIMACSTGEEKRLTDLKKKIECIRLHNPSFKDAFAYTVQILDTEEYEYDGKEVMDVVKSMQCNIRNIVLNVFSALNVEEEKALRNYMDMNIFEIVERIFNNYGESLKELDVALSYDPTLASFMMYDNFKAYVTSKYKVDLDNNINAPINDAYIVASCFEDCAFKNNDWDLIEICNLLRCGSIRLAQKKLTKKSRPDDYRINYTQITTRAAQHYNNMKKLKTYIDTNKISHENMVLLGDFCFEKQCKLPAKSEEYNVISAYVSNICNKDNLIYNNRKVIINKKCN